MSCMYYESAHTCTFLPSSKFWCAPSSGAPGRQDLHRLSNARRLVESQVCAAHWIWSLFGLSGPYGFNAHAHIESLLKSTGSQALGYEVKEFDAFLVGRRLFSAKLRGTSRCRRNPEGSVKTRSPPSSLPTSTRFTSPV